MTPYTKERWRNTKVKVCTPDGDTDFFDIVAGVLQGDTLAPCLFIICPDNVLRMSIDLLKENSFTLVKARSKIYPTRTIMDVDYADEIALLVNTPTQAESLLHNLEKAASCIGLHVNADKEDISTLRSLKLVDKFTYFGSSVSSSW